MRIRDKHHKANLDMDMDEVRTRYHCNENGLMTFIATREFVSATQSVHAQVESFKRVLGHLPQQF